MKMDYMRILAIGDVTATPGKRVLCENLKNIIFEYKIDFCIANCENVANTNGISTRDESDLFMAGVDVITLGNHAFSNYGAYKILEHNQNVIRPINYPEAPGKGYVIKNVFRKRILVANALGRVFMNNQIDCPFRSLIQLVEKKKKFADIMILDFHAEATSEKIALANYLDGHFNIIFGTHTHVQTADERIFPKGTAYITDLGMTGDEDSILGVKKEIVIKSFVSGRHIRHEKSDGMGTLCGAIFEVDNISFKVISIKRIRFNVKKSFAN